MSKPKPPTAGGSSEAGERPWHHLPDGTFRNPKGSPKKSVSLRVTLPFFAEMFGKSFSKVDVPSSHIMSRDEAQEGLARHLAGTDDFLTWLGHASFLIRIAGKMILTDPYLTSYAGPAGLGPKRFVKSGIAIRDLPPIDILAVSHNHYDHLDERALALLQGKDRMTVVVPLKLGDFFRKRGFTHVVDMDWYDELIVNDLKVTALPVVHWSRRVGFDYNTSLWAGFAFKGPDHHLMFGGDSGYGPVFKDTGERYGPFNTALLGIGAYAPREMMRASHATPEEAVEMGRDLRAHTLVGMHWGTVVLTQEPPFEPPKRFLAAGRKGGYDEDDIWIMKIGETRKLEPGWPSNS
ncbi:MAG: MBL fold metallo-hydrolase [Rhodobiaceae bacterium]|nr:MBL fold metallo-hydrolase [Rhodobiaceae bacterium]